MTGRVHLATPDAASFIRSLPADPATAAAMCDGALLGNRVDPHWTPDEAALVAQEFARRRAAAERAAVSKGGR